jgi:hypothetical protein
VTVSKEQNGNPVCQSDATNAAVSEAQLREQIRRLDDLIAVGLQYLGDPPAERPARLDSATADRAQVLRSEIARREQLVAALEELEARRQEVRELRQRLGLPAHGEATAPVVSRVPSRVARWAQTAWMRALITYGVQAVYLLAIVLFAFLRLKTRSLIGVVLAHSVALVLWAGALGPGPAACHTGGALTP